MASFTTAPNVLGALPPSMIAEVQAEQFYLHNITDIERGYIRPYGAGRIAATGHGERYATTVLKGVVTQIDIGDERKMQSIIRAKEIALDVESEINGNVGDGITSFTGVFASPNAVPTEAELADADARLSAFYTAMVGYGDKWWEQTHRMDFISEAMRRGAKYLKLDREWCSSAKAQTECPACGVFIKPNVAVCKSCGAILDREKAIQFGILQSAPQDTPKRGKSHA